MAAKQEPKYFIIAESLRVARICAEQDWGWQRDKTGWRDPEGHRVQYCDRIERLNGLGQVFIYEGYRWYAKIAPGDVDGLTPSGRLKVLTPTIVAKKKPVSK